MEQQIIPLCVSPPSGKDCGECEACLDKVKFGGKNVKKRACERRPPFSAPAVPAAAAGAKRKRGPRKKKQNAAAMAEQQPQSGLQQIINIQASNNPHLMHKQYKPTS